MKASRGEKVFNFFNIIFMLLLAVVVVYPFINILAISFNDGIDTINGGITVFPRIFTLENYRIAVNYPAIGTAAIVSIARTVLSTVYHLLIVTMAAFALNKKDIPLRRTFLVFLTIPIFISGGLVPAYINMSMLKLVNRFWVYVLPFGFNFFHFIIIRTYMNSIPSSLEEAALIDGAGFFKIYYSIIIPLSMPAITAIALFTAVGQWNDWYTTMIYISNKNLYTLQYILQQILKENMTREIVSFADYMEQANRVKRITPKSIQSAILMLTTMPIIIVYPFLQKYFVKGMMIGSIKG